MTRRRSSLFLSVLFLLVFSNASATSTKGNTRTRVILHIVNYSESNVYAQWVNPSTGELIELNRLDDPCRPKSTVRYNSFVNDELVFYEMGDDCRGDWNCQSTKLKVPGPLLTSTVEGYDLAAYQEAFVIDSSFHIQRITDPAKLEEIFSKQNQSQGPPTQNQMEPMSSTHHKRTAYLHVSNLCQDCFVDIYWVHNDDNSLLKLTAGGPLLPFATNEAESRVKLDTFMGDRFQLRETHSCREQDCRTIDIIVPERQDSMLVIRDGFKVTIQTNEETSVAQSEALGESCREEGVCTQEEIDAVPMPKAMGMYKTLGKKRYSSPSESKELSEEDTPAEPLQNFVTSPSQTGESKSFDSTQDTNTEDEQILKEETRNTETERIEFRPPSTASLQHPQLQDYFRRKARHSKVQSNLQIINESGSPIDIFYVSSLEPAKLRLTNLYPLPDGGVFPHITLVYEEFEVRETGPCEPTEEVGNDDARAACRRVRFRTANESPVITITASFQPIMYGRDISSPRRQAIESMNILDKTQPAPFHERVWKQCLKETQLITGGQGALDSERFVQSIQECVVEILIDNITSLNALQQDITKNRIAFIDRYERISCKDLDAPTSEPLYSQEWDNAREEQKHKVSVLLDRPAAKIHIIDNFVSQEECEFIERTRVGQYQKALINDDDTYGARSHGHRIAHQAPLVVPWQRECEGHKFVGVARRMYDYVNDVLSSNLIPVGQEQPTIIRYVGKGFDDPFPEQYKVHCDGRCDGETYPSGTRVATMILYCAVADAGGQTIFRNASIYIKPEIGSALFFNYVDQETGRMDDGLTQHAGCPVYMGEKKIITQWFREGVDAENPYHLFDLAGNKMSTEEFNQMRARMLGNVAGM